MNIEPCEGCKYRRQNMRIYPCSVCERINYERRDRYEKEE